jgi:enamine deaminase RidA (YjgF/YER057c/UK114 family)
MNTDITRYGTGPRMSEAVAYNGILWVAGQLGEPGGSVADQTRQALAAIDVILAKAGTDKTRILAGRHGDLPGNELRLGHLGTAGPYPGPRHG